MNLLMDERRLLMLYTLQIHAYSSFPVTLSILIFLTAINKEKLEKTTGLKILQTGVGEVSGLRAFYTLKKILIWGFF